jgi:pimeloyl-ACP methyl ester carboxylesterase
MSSFITDGVQIAFDDITPPNPAGGGAQKTIVLIHGFASNRVEGWKRTGWYAAFERRGVRVIALDQRGHGESAKLYEPAAYAREQLAADVLNLMDHLGVDRADVFGYSMGTRTALELAIGQPDRVSHLILGGVGGKLLEKAPDVAGEPMAVTCMRNMPFDPDALAELPMPVLVVAGAGDEGAGDPEVLARVFPHGKGVAIPGCDHFSAIPHALTKAAVFDFLDGVMDDDFPPVE